MSYFTKNMCITLGVTLCLIVSSTLAQTRCNSACANDLACSSNQCQLTSCSDLGSCYQYCLKCNDITTCYATGTTCDFSGGIQTNASNKVKFSIYLSILTFFLYNIFK